jgi:rhodanese-related sulfurtransferase
LQFIMKNLWLVALVVVSGGMLVWPMLRRGALGIPEVSPAQAVTLINREHALVLDVRNDAEFATGHITNARHIPLDQLQSRLGELGRFRDKAMVVNCQGGVRSASACAVLKKQGFGRVHNLKGGISAWIDAKLPVTRE